MSHRIRSVIPGLLICLVLGAVSAVMTAVDGSRLRGFEIHQGSCAAAEANWRWGLFRRAGFERIEIDAPPEPVLGGSPLLFPPGVLQGVDGVKRACRLPLWVRWRETDPPRDVGFAEEWTEYAGGWPLRALTGSRVRRGEDVTWSHVLVLEDGEFEWLLPHRPLWGGLVANVLFWTAVFSLCGLLFRGIRVSCSGMRSRRRVAAGCCPACGYSCRRAGSEYCSECGFESTPPPNL